MTIQIVATCGICGEEQTIDATRPLTDKALERALDFYGWHRRQDGLSEVCPEHPVTR